MQETKQNEASAVMPQRRPARVPALASPDMRSQVAAQRGTPAVTSEEGNVASEATATHAPEDILIAWEGPEFENFRKDTQWYIAAAIILLLIITYAVVINAPIMAITFILIGVVSYIYVQKEPRHLRFAVTQQGIVVGDEVFPFTDIASYWIFYEPPHTYLLSLEMKHRLLPHVHIPLHGVDIAALHEVLDQFLPEEEQEMGIVDTLERLLHR